MREHKRIPEPWGITPQLRIKLYAFYAIIALVGGGIILYCVSTP